MQLIEAKNISVQFENKSALEDISFNIEKGEYVGIIGPNGAGKSTLLKVLAGIIPFKGDLHLAKNVKIGYVPQNYLPQSSFSISVEEVLAMGLQNSFIWNKKQNKKDILEKLSIVGLGEEFLDKSFHVLSGGQKQRVIIARALLQDPSILLFDEPLSSLDATSRINIYKLLAEINKKHGTTILFVSHEVESIVKQCKRIICLNKSIHEGCHPMDFIEGKIDQCSVLESSTTVQPIHHHHKHP